jgi:hypothetical protein
MSTATLSTPFPAVGQVWRSRDPRQGGRTITIKGVGSSRVSFINARGELRTISIARLRPWGLTKGYEFVSVLLIPIPESAPADSL